MKPGAAVPAKLGPEAIQALPLARYEGPVEVLTDAAQVKAAAAAWGDELLWGFDTETKPVFRRGVRHDPALLQLAGERAVYLVHLPGAGLPPEICSLLADPRCIKAGVAIERDVQELTAFAPFNPAGFVDLGCVARRHGFPHHGLRGLAACLLGLRISKSAQRSNWGRWPLTRTQLVYAATDAWISRRIYQHLRSTGFLQVPSGSAKSM